MIEEFKTVGAGLGIGGSALALIAFLWRLIQSIGLSDKFNRANWDRNMNALDTQSCVVKEMKETIEWLSTANKELREENERCFDKNSELKQKIWALNNEIEVLKIKIKQGGL